MRDRFDTTVASGLGDRPAGRKIPEHIDALLHTSEAAHILGLSHRTLEALRLRGGGPPFVAVTPKAIRYRRRDIDAFIEERLRTNTSDPGLAADRAATDATKKAFDHGTG